MILMVVFHSRLMKKISTGNFSHYYCSCILDDFKWRCTEEIHYSWLMPSKLHEHNIIFKFDHHAESVAVTYNLRFFISNKHLGI